MGQVLKLQAPAKAPFMSSHLISLVHFTRKESEKLVSRSYLEKQNLDSNPAESRLLPPSPQPPCSVSWEEEGIQTKEIVSSGMGIGSECLENRYMLKGL